MGHVVGRSRKIPNMEYGDAKTILARDVGAVGAV